jgi:methylmalonyl-CoA/ethylmalonyl-CoA epimerase
VTATRLHHVGIVVEDLAPVVAVLRDVLKLEVVGPEVEPALSMEILWVAVGGVELQFIRPTRDDTRAARVLRERGPGVHHVGLEVADIVAVLHDLRARGVPTRDDVPRPGGRGARVAFIDPQAVAGTEIELVEPGA